MNYDKIGEFIASKRKEKNLTQKDLAKKIGVTDKAVSKWERGLGCPDVSILEILATELDVSVLELLKGREIENEIIKVTEADDYIKKTLKVSKEQTKDKIFNNISQIIFYLILFISIIFTLLSIINYSNGKKGEFIKVDQDIKNEYFTSLDKLKDNYNIIKNNKGILTENEHQELVNNLDKFINYFSTLHYPLNIKNNKKYTYNDVLMNFLYSITTNEYPSEITVSTMNILKNHKLFNDYMRYSILFTMYEESMFEIEFIMNYQKNNQDYFSLKSTGAVTDYVATFSEDYDYELSMFIEALYRVGQRRIELYTHFTDDIIKAGDLNE